MVVCGVTVLARRFGPRHHCQGDRRPGNSATSIANVNIEAVSSTQQMARWLKVAGG